jgi:hypothetical protein
MVALSSALVGLVILPILMGPLAIVTGTASCGAGDAKRGAAIAGLLIGIFDTIIVVVRMWPYFMSYLATNGGY